MTSNLATGYQESRFLKIIEQHLTGIPDAALTELSKKLFPIISSTNIFSAFYNCVHTFYTIRMNKGTELEAINNEILKFAQDIKDQSVYSKIRQLLEDQQFRQLMTQIVQRELASRKKIIHVQKNDQSNNNTSNGQVAKMNGTISNGSTTTQKNTSPPPPQQQTQPQSKISTVTMNTKQSQKTTTIDIEDVQTVPVPPVNTTTVQGTKANLQSTFQPNFLGTSDPYEVPNLGQRRICLCGKSCQAISPKRQTVFKCSHCKSYYHVQCMQRGKQTVNQTDPLKKLMSCAYCHLRKLIPTKEAIKTVFVGVLKQGRKRHQITFNLDLDDLRLKKLKLQVRCFRLKQKIQTCVLFPDSAAFTINKRFQKQFLPLPKQSSLKYRKDEPFLLINHLVNHENKLSIIERLPKKQSKDDRIQPENHLIGLYLVQDKSIPEIIKDIQINSVYNFNQSKNLLQRCFRVGQAQDITCQVVKIPLLCTLTIQRIKTPVRGSFCTHYQCFDLNNFLILTSQSANPRWLCPLCKQPAYSFKYDIILASIIQEYNKLEPTQVMFSNDGQFKVYAKQQLCSGETTNIQNLKIQQKHKRPLQNPIGEEELMRQPEKPEQQQQKIDVSSEQVSLSSKNNNKFVLPVNSNIIDLDD